VANNRTYTDAIIIHGTKLSSLEELHRLHLNQGIRSESGPTGFHYIIHPDGGLRTGRAIEEIGAHSRGYNEHSVGIVLVGRRAGLQPYTPTAMRVLLGLTRDLQERYYATRPHIVGHSQFSSHDCPGFDVEAWAHTKGLQCKSLLLAS